MRKAQGYATLIGPAVDSQRMPAFRGQGEMAECDTFTCGHCNSIVHVPPRAAPENIGGMCRQCVKLICPTCVDLGVCVPFERQLERMESLRSYGF